MTKTQIKSNRHSRSWRITMLLLLFSSSLCLGQSQNTTSVSAGDVLERIKANLGVAWQDGGMDGFKSGAANSKIAGVTVTLFPTFAVLKKAAESGNNFVICHEPLFYAGCADEESTEDAVLLAKRQLIVDHDLVVYRFHDNIHRMKPDGIHRGMIERLHWTDLMTDEQGSNRFFKTPETTLGAFAAGLAKRLDTDTIRVVGDPQMSFQTFALSAGAWYSKDHVELLRRDDVQVLVIGESREWETIEYVRDAVDSGQRKALIVLGHANSEEAGMKWCAEWMRRFVTKIPVVHIPSGEPYWAADKSK